MISIINLKTPRRQVKSTTLGWEKVVKESWKLVMCKLGQPESCQWRYYAESATDESPSAPTGQRLLCTRGLRRTRGCVEGWFVAQLDQIFRHPDNNKILYSNELGVGWLAMTRKGSWFFQYWADEQFRDRLVWQLLVVQLLFHGLTVHNGGLGG